MKNFFVITLLACTIFILCTAESCQKVPPCAHCIKKDAQGNVTEEEGFCQTTHSDNDKQEFDNKVHLFVSANYACTID